MYILRRTVTIATKSEPALAKKRISPHTRRHTTGMHLLQSGVDLTTIQAWLGHASTDTTHQYVEADLEMKRRALEKCSFMQAKPAIYQPPDEVLAMLDKLEIYGKQSET